MRGKFCFFNHISILGLGLIFSITYTVKGYNYTNEIQSDSSRVCRVPRFAPYFWVKDVTSTEIELGLTDPNTSGVLAYTAYYWGHRHGVESTVNKIHRDFGLQNISRGGPYKISGLKPGFLYCADITAINDCGHGPFCIACFENVFTLQN